MRGAGGEVSAMISYVEILTVAARARWRGSALVAALVVSLARAARHLRPSRSLCRRPLHMHLALFKICAKLYDVLMWEGPLRAILKY